MTDALRALTLKERALRIKYNAQRWRNSPAAIVIPAHFLAMIDDALQVIADQTERIDHLEGAAREKSSS